MNAYIFPTFECTLNCPRCYQKGHRGQSMSWDTFCRVRQMLNKIEPKEIVFTGGEPTMWPFLVDAIEVVYEIARVRVITNGFNCNIEDYGCADCIQVSDYGGINRMDIYRLKKQGGRKVKIQTPIHWTWDRSVTSKLPGVCGCVGYSFAEQKVWPCAMAAALRTDNGLEIERAIEFRIIEAQSQNLCKSCLVNRKNRQAPKPVFQFSIWEGKSYILG